MGDAAPAEGEVAKDANEPDWKRLHSYSLIRTTGELGDLLPLNPGAK